MNNRYVVTLPGSEAPSIDDLQDNKKIVSVVTLPRSEDPSMYSHTANTLDMKS